MRWINKLSDTDIENLVKKSGIEYVSLKIKKETDCINVYLDSSCWYALAIFDFSVMVCDDEEEYWTYYSSITIEKTLYLFMENKFGREYLIDLIRNNTGLSGKFLRKKLK